MILIEVDEICRKLKPVLGEQVDRLWSLYQTEKPEGRKWIQVTLLKLARQHLNQTYEEKKLLLPPPPKATCSGHYELGRVCYGDNATLPFGLREKEWIQHVGIFGRSGSGKTNIGFNIALKLARAGKPFLIFDWKRSYRDLLSVRPDILVFTAGRDVCPFHFNPLMPPRGTSPKIWLKKLIEIIAHTYFLGEGVKYLLQEAINSVFKGFGVYDGRPDHYPTMGDVLVWLENRKPRGRQAEWMRSTLRAISVLCFGEFGAVLNVRRPCPLAELLKRRVILELDALTNSDKTFLIEALLLWLHHYRMVEGRREEFKHALIVEEAHHVLLRRKQEMMGEETITDIILREIRELGEAVVLLDQHPSLISKPALGNTYTTIAMNLKHRDDVRAAANAMLLGRGEQEYLGELEVGSGIVKLQGRWFRPFLVEFPLVRVEKGTVTDRMLRRKMKQMSRAGAGVLERALLAAKDSKTAAGAEKSSPPDSGATQNASGGSEANGGRPGTGGAKPEGPRPSDGSAKEGGRRKEAGREALMTDIVRFPYSPTQDRYRRLGWSFYKGNRIRDGLAEGGMIRVRALKRPDGMVKLFELTRKGQERAEEIGLKVERTWRKGGLEHGYWVQEMAGLLRAQGFAVQVERALGKGRSVDLEARKGDRKIAVEVETGKSEPIRNVRKDLAAGYDRIAVVCLGANVRHKIRERLAELDCPGKERVRVMTVKDALRNAGAALTARTAPRDR